MVAIGAVDGDASAIFVIGAGWAFLAAQAIEQQWVATAGPAVYNCQDQVAHRDIVDFVAVDGADDQGECLIDGAGHRYRLGRRCVERVDPHNICP